MPSNSAGGVFLPGDPPPATNMVLTTPAITSPTFAGTSTGTMTWAGTTTLTSPTLTTPAITSPAITGGSTTIAFQVLAATSAGATGTDATAITIGAPGLVSITGASGAGVGLPTGAAIAGAVYFLRNINAATGVQNVYAVGATINGTTGTTALALSPTGTKAATLMCVTAGAWLVSGISTT